MTKSKNIIELPADTIIEVVRINKVTGKVVKKEMTFGEWKVYKKHKGYWYRPFKKGYSQFKINNKE